MEEELILEKRLDTLKIEHRHIDATIKRMEEEDDDVFTMRRLKKEKLKLRDQINEIENDLYPNIVA